MNKKILLALGLVLVIGAVLFFFSPSTKTPTDELTLVEQDKKLHGPCPGAVEIVSGAKVVTNWYACHKVQKGDVVLYQFSGTKPPVIRTVAAVENDEFSWVEDKKHQAWNLKVDSKMVLDADKNPHFFGRFGTPPMISLNAGKTSGVLKKDTAIIFANESPGGLDSSMFGVVNQVDFLGKVEAPSEPAK